MIRCHFPRRFFSGSRQFSITHTQVEIASFNAFALLKTTFEPVASAGDETSCVTLVTIYDVRDQPIAMISIQNSDAVSFITLERD